MHLNGWRVGRRCDRQLGAGNSWDANAERIRRPGRLDAGTDAQLQDVAAALFDREIDRFLPQPPDGLEDFIV